MTLRIAVVGDAIIDMYHFGTADRLSPEAPCPVFVETRSETRRGGADNVLHQLEVWGVEAQGFFPPRRSVKHRFMVGHHQLFRRDSDQIATGWTLGDDLSGFDAIVLSDYNKGACNYDLCSQVMHAGPPVIVDPKGGDWGRYGGAYVVCPNEREYDQWDRTHHFERVLLKRGEAGIDVIERGKNQYNVPAKARHVFDVTGAGDVVVAAVAWAIAGGESLRTAAEIACIAAGYAVGEVGTTVCPLNYLREQCASSSVQGVSTSSMKATATS